MSGDIETLGGTFRGHLAGICGNSTEFRKWWRKCVDFFWGIPDGGDSRWGEFRVISFLTPGGASPTELSGGNVGKCVSN